jgi:hypothetical protein
MTGEQSAAPTTPSEPTVEDVLGKWIDELNLIVAGLNRDKSYQLAQKTQELLIHVDHYRMELDTWQEWTWKDFLEIPVWED